MKKLDRKQMAARVARDIPEGAYVNLGIGLPTLVADHLPKGKEILLHSENGVLGIGPRPPAGEEDEDLINAGKEPVTLLTGGAYFHHADSFAMIRGRHLDFAVLGAFQVSVAGDLANWHTGAADAIPAVGGAMDLAVGAKKETASAKLRLPAVVSRSISTASCSSCSSNIDGSTTAAAPLSSRRMMLSRSRLSGDAEAMSGFFSVNPR